MDNTEKNSILVVDDQPNNLKVISSVLSSQYTLFIANSGDRAVKILERTIPDLILLDVMMPDMSGYEVCELLKKNPLTADIPIIFLTAKSDIDDIVKGFELGAVDYITKPFNIREVVVRINNQIQLANALKIIKKQRNELETANNTLITTQDELISRNVELEIAKSKLEQSILEKDKFFSIIAHDLKAPFTGFLGLTKIITENFSDLSLREINEYANSLKISADNIFKLLENLLQWSRIQRGMVQLNPEIVQVNQIVMMNVSLLDANLNKKNISIQNNINEDVYVSADLNMLNTIFRNLLSNAVKFTPHDGTISFNTKEDNGLITICVKDSGIGMPKELLDNLFVLGAKTSREGTDNESSTGLGLLLCKEYAEMNGGRIYAESEEGKGSTFCFTLPKGIIEE